MKPISPVEPDDDVDFACGVSGIYAISAAAILGAGACLVTASLAQLGVIVLPIAATGALLVGALVCSLVATLILGATSVPAAFVFAMGHDDPKAVGSAASATSLIASTLIMIAAILAPIAGFAGSIAIAYTTVLPPLLMAMALLTVAGTGIMTGALLVASTSHATLWLFLALALLGGMISKQDRKDGLTHPIAQISTKSSPNPLV